MDGAVLNLADCLKVLSGTPRGRGGGFGGGNLGKRERSKLRLTNPRNKGMSLYIAPLLQLLDLMIVSRSLSAGALAAIRPKPALRPQVAIPALLCSSKPAAG
jgi:hypothetical protein